MSKPSPTRSAVTGLTAIGLALAVWGLDLRLADRTQGVVPVTAGPAAALAQGRSGESNGRAGENGLPDNPGNSGNAGGGQGGPQGNAFGLSNSVAPGPLAAGNGGPPAVGNAGGNGRFSGEWAGDTAVVFSATETSALIANGWRGRLSEDGGFANHGERVRTMVAIAQALGLSASVGAMQANFGTPQEAGVTDLLAEMAALEQLLEDGPTDPLLTSDELAAALAAELAAIEEAADDALGGDFDIAGIDPSLTRADWETALAGAGIDPTDPAVAAALDALEGGQTTALAEALAEWQEEIGGEITTLEEQIADAIADMKPGDGPMDGWETISLDADGNGVVDEADLQWLLDGNAPVG